MTRVNWDDDGILGKPWVWIEQRLRSLLPQVGLNRDHIYSSPPTKVFKTRFAVDKMNRRDRRKALNFALPDLLPIDPEHLTVFARVISNKPHIEVAAIRKVDLAGLPQKVTRLDLGDGWVPMLEQRRKDVRRKAMFGWAGGATIGALILLGLNIAESSSSAELETMLAREAELRRDAIAAMGDRRDEWQLSLLEAEQVHERHPGVVLENLAKLNDATPDDTYWSDLVWTATSVGLRGRSMDALRLADELRNVDGVERVDFVAPITTSDTGRMEYDIQIEWKAETH